MGFCKRFPAAMDIVFLLPPVTVIQQGFYFKHDKGESVFVSLKFGTIGELKEKIQLLSVQSETPKAQFRQPHLQHSYLGFFSAFSSHIPQHLREGRRSPSQYK